MIHCLTDIPVILPDNDELTLDKYIGKGLQSGEQELPDEVASECQFTSVSSNCLILDHSGCRAHLQRGCYVTVEHDGVLRNQMQEGFVSDRQ